MRRLLTIVVAAAAVGATVLTVPASADTTAGCTGHFNGANTCEFTLPDGATGFRLVLTADEGSAAVASAYCCGVVDPVSGDDLLPILRFGAGCSSTGGTCDSGYTFPALLPLVQSHAVHCDVGPIDERPSTGDWACVPAFPG